MTAARSLDDIWTAILSLIPRGWVWPRTKTSNFGRSFYALADAQATLEAVAENMINEMDPLSAEQLLPDFERVLGPDPTADPTAPPPTLAQQQQITFRRWTMAPGGQSAAYFIGLCAAQGVPVTITTFQPFVAGAATAGTRVISSPQSRIWQVNLPPTQVIPFRAGASSAGNSIGAIVPVGVERMLRLYKPADTAVVFNYQAAA